MGIIVFIFGLLLGSFYNVVGLRLPNGESIVFPGSHCPSCNHKLSWYENIPVFSYLFLDGKCKSCHKPISIMYPLIELFTGSLFLISYSIFGISENFFIGVILSSLVAIIFVSDSKYMIILDSPLVISSILILVVRFIYHDHDISVVGHYLLGGIVTFGIMYLLMLFGNFLFKKETMGGGDIKLSFVSGIALGPVLGIFYIVLGAFLALPYALYITIRKKENMLPFGPFLAISMLIIFFNMDKTLEFIKYILYLK